ncbi:hypothetical protein [Lutispora thermophila]|uniref:Bla regulator protein blaR1 n=1 Tax=Lutispora thermophila DSM 19022 TaxID=1122184 RepID=A0A1M6BD81_9FIRM|nr:hypothetical protein [Lutispora thermophila]SHI46691.1 bla regulator protein blaR1 [Lutispora thermophila DSM 19022]
MLRRITRFLFFSGILIFLFTSCSPKKESDMTWSNDSTESNEGYPDIVVNSPITLSNNDLFNINGKHQYLRLKMVKGKYYENWNPGAYMGTLWEGYFIIELADDHGNTIAVTDLSKSFEEPLIFNSPFEIQFDDYNNDGDIDFTIGQYATSNGTDYKLFTLRKEGNVEELVIRDYPTLFISDESGHYSTKLKKADDISFKRQYYDNSTGKHIEDIFRWDGEEFVKVESYEVKDRM